MIRLQAQEGSYLSINVCFWPVAEVQRENGSSPSRPVETATQSRPLAFF
jgi:hypothetical protein